MGKTCSTHGDTGNTCKILIRKPEEKTSHGRYRHKWDYNIIRMDLKERRWEDVNCI